MCSVVRCCSGTRPVVSMQLHCRFKFLINNAEETVVKKIFLRQSERWIYKIDQKKKILLFLVMQNSGIMNYISFALVQTWNALKRTFIVIIMVLSTAAVLRYWNIHWPKEQSVKSWAWSFWETPILSLLRKQSIRKDEAGSDDSEQMSSAVQVSKLRFRTELMCLF